MQESRTPSLFAAKSFLAHSWKTHEELEEIQYRGLAQFAYTTMCADIEEVLSRIIELRCKTILSSSMNYHLLEFPYMENGKKTHCDTRIIVESIMRLARSLKKDASKYPFNKLVETYKNLFGKSVADTLSDGLFNDVEAIADLRNLFAHGRPIVYRGETESFAEELNLSRHPFEKVSKRLRAVNILDSKTLAMNETKELEKAIFSPTTIEYFSSSCSEAMSELFEAIDFPSEKDKLHFSMHLREFPLLKSKRE